jgi:hypothetical protein
VQQPPFRWKNAELTSRPLRFLLFKLILKCGGVLSGGKNENQHELTDAGHLVHPSLSARQLETGIKDGRLAWLAQRKLAKSCRC